MNLFYGFVFFTGLMISVLNFRTKYFYEDKKLQSRKVEGPLIVISNHTSLYDYVATVNAFRLKYLRVVGSEALFKSKSNAWFFRNLGMIKAERFNHDYGYLKQCQDVLENKGMVLLYPEARLPKPGETDMKFTNGATFLALESNVQILPIFVQNVNNFKKRTKVVIGMPIDVNTMIDGTLTKEQNIERITSTLKEKVYSLKGLIDVKKS